MSVERFSGAELEELRRNKDEVFSFVSDYSAANYKSFKENFSAIEGQANPDDQARKLLSLWESDLFMVNQDRNTEYVLPGIAAIQAFDYSMNLLAKSVDPELKKQIVDAQVKLLLDSVHNEELYNNLVGIWGYYISSEKVSTEIDMDPHPELLIGTLSDYYVIHNSLKNAMKELSDQEMLLKKPDAKKLWYLSLGASGTLMSEDREKTDKIRYFASIYNGDKKSFQEEPGFLSPQLSDNPGISEPETSGEDNVNVEPSPITEVEPEANIPPEPASQPALDSGIKKGGERVDFEAGLKASPHVRFYSFIKDRLPTQDVIANDRAAFYISADSRVLVTPELGSARISSKIKEDIIVDRLPVQIMERYTNNMLAVRGDEYYAGSLEDRKKMREEAVKNFTQDLLNFKSKLWKQLEQEFADSPQSIEGIKQMLAKHSLEKAFIVVAISINKTFDSNKVTDVQPTV